MRTLSKLQTIDLGVSFSLGGCKDTSQYFKKRGVVDSKYQGIAEVDRGGRHLRIYGDIDEHYVYASDGNNDGRFDAVYITVSKGDPLEEYASLEKLEEAYRKIVDEE